MAFHKKRITALRRKMADEKLDTLLVLKEENRRYLTGFCGEDFQCDESAGALIITNDQLILATDSRFEIQAIHEAPDFEVRIYHNGLAKILPELADQLNIRRLGLESMRVSIYMLQEFEKELATAKHPVELVPLNYFVETLRLVKSEDEIKYTAKALDLAESVFRQVVKTIQPGMSEKDLAWAMEKGMRQAGADNISFPVIVAAGPNSALAHAIPTDRPIRAGEPILFDWGAKLYGYCSDTSRTVIIGTPDEKFLKIFNTVLNAQTQATNTIRHGVSSKAVDTVARDYIARQGFKDKFGHGLGHGTGLATHEWPRFSPFEDSILQSGMIVTVEPGIYFEDWGGVRIENQVVVTDNGAQVLNKLKTTYNISDI